MTFHAEQVAEALAELIRDRAERGNCQSKHGIDAATSYELWYVMDKLDQMLGETP
jgi:hypothetical protein